MREPIDTNADQDASRRLALSPLVDLDRFRPRSSTVSVEFAARSHSGLERARNEDHYLVLRFGRTQSTVLSSLPTSDVPGRFEEQGYAMLVADGLGGEGPGAVASRVALSTLAHLALHFGRWNVRVEGNSATDVAERAEWYYRQVNDAIIAKASSQESLAGMATTLTAAYSAGDDLFLAHVGHSRAYIYRDGDLTQLTTDQTVARRMIEQPPKPAPVELATERLRHILTEAIGVRPGAPEVEVEHFKLWDGDTLLLCTDGLSGLIREDDIADVLSLRRAADEQCHHLVNLALDRGGSDNVTVVLARSRIPPF